MAAFRIDSRIKRARIAALLADLHHCANGAATIIPCRLGEDQHTSVESYELNAAGVLLDRVDDILGELRKVGSLVG
jgi:hypothetical protein